MNLQTTEQNTKTANSRTATTAGHSNPCVPPKLASGPATIRLYHVVGPTCWWSWGYQGVITRIRLVYGDQVDIRLPVVPVWQDLESWLAHSGLDHDGWEAWAKESQQTMGVPIFTAYGTSRQPKDSTPAALAVVAAYQQGQPKGERFAREIIRRATVEGRDVTTEAELLDAAAASGLDVAKFRAANADRAARLADLDAQGNEAPHGGIGFYNLLVEDENGRRVILDNAFDPKDVEGAIEYLSGGRLKKNVPTDPVEYLHASGAAPAQEIARAFGMTAQQANARLGELQQAGRVKTVTLAGAPHYVAA